jgi:hypothetical protein
MANIRRPIGMVAMANGSSFDGVVLIVSTGASVRAWA